MTDKGSTVFLRRQRYQKTIEFANRCVHVCWLMAVQDPPVVFGNLPKKYKKIDTNAYRPYTSSGSETDYAVWPALYLHENGPILCKGVVQPISDKNRTVSEERGESRSASTITHYSDDHFLKNPSDRHDLTRTSPKYDIYSHSQKNTHGTYSHRDKASDITSAIRNRDTESVYDTYDDHARYRASTLYSTNVRIPDDMNKVSLGTQASGGPLYDQMEPKFNYLQTIHRTHYTPGYIEHRHPETYRMRWHSGRHLHLNTCISHRSAWK